MSDEDLKRLAAEHGHETVEDFLAEESIHSKVWGLCDHCGHTECRAEPDLRNGICSACGEPAFSSVLTL
jgi:hypothetical protein